MKNDNRLSKYNYRTRKNYSMWNILLEKYLLYNSSYFTEVPMVYVITDLKTYYDR